ncbi:DUF4183 domain-containing protein [Pseudalkalibacillus hwajinpoensis]|uniref:DUF4183 domain-containing protein n=1 Tax=Guptibacillus hwajinpoensis TaxID=208199 RepID=UPI001CD2263B|nr:DUF4183 domain-containing protein [Pseudalkalibacillus hwajinpoensis]MCA0990315.1 DUF4183 domain-containing protein [Pseudalkalibacillus hwajinpoensis]
MALQIMKIVVDVSSTITTTPTVQRFFYNTTGLLVGPTTLTIDAADFFDDTGAAVTTLPSLSTDNSYFNVYVNGVLQMEELSTYTPGATGVGQLEFDIPALASILVNTPFVLEVVNFTPTSSSTVST